MALATKVYENIQKEEASHTNSEEASDNKDDDVKEADIEEE